MNRVDWHEKKAQALILAAAGLLILVGMIYLSNLGPSIAEAGFRPGVVETGPRLVTEWVFQGMVYEGEVWDETHPLEGVTVSLYGANDPCPASGEWVDSTVTNDEGWYGLRVDDNDFSYEYYYILETDPSGYVSVGASSVDGEVRSSNWIEYVVPLDRKTLTGNKFWDRLPATPTPMLTPSWMLQGRVYEGNVGDHTHPLQGVTVEVYGADNPYPDAGTFITSTLTSEEGWYGLPVGGSYEYYHIREIDPSGYVSAGATSVDGVARAANWIEYVIPLDEKTLTGNKFWDRPLTAETATPTPSHTPTCTPAGATPAPTFTPTPAQSPVPPTPTGLDLRVEHVELTQAIQCKDNSHCPDNAVPLISGKDTYVRVYVEVIGTSASVPNVSARVTAKMPWGDYTTDPINATITAKLSPQRSHFNDTLNFYLPASMVDASGTLVVEINPSRAVAEVDYTNNQKTVNLTFVSTLPLIIVPIWIDYDFGGTQAIVDGSMHYNMGYYLKNILPVGQIQWHILPGPSLKWTQQIGPGGGSWGAILAKLTDMRKKNSSVPTSAHWYAMVPFKIAQGWIGGMAYMPGKVAAGRVPVQHENFEDAADIMAHELGHNFNRGHSPCGVTPSDPNYPYPNARLGDYGWDPQVAGGGKAQSWPGGFVVPATSFDVMSYCQDEWISEYTYRAILNYRGTSPATFGSGSDKQMSVASAPLQWLSADWRQYLFASGTIFEDGAELDPWAILERPEGSDDGQGEGPYLLRLIAANEETLFERHFSTEMLQESWLPGTWVGSMEEEGTHAFYEILPWHPGTAQIQVWHGEHLLAERIVSDHPPIVEVIVPRGGDYWPADGEEIIEWSAEDEDGGPLWFDVSFSRDGGETWDVIATRLEQNYLAVCGDQFPGTEGAMLRVRASDGVLTSDAITGPFAIEPKAPQVSIGAPLDGATLPEGVPFRLRGYVYDPEDGVLSGEAMEWDSDRDGWLGHGSDRLVEGLSPGRHTIILRAADGDEQIGSDSVSILVGNWIHLPLVTKG